MKRLLKLLTGRSALAVLALSVVLWWIGPLIAIDTLRPLESAAARVVAIALLCCAWIGRLAHAAWRRRRVQAALVQGIATPSAAEREAQVLAQRFREAVTKLESAGDRGWFFSRRRTLHELPWYVFVGSPGSGKTTALRNAGLQFMLGEDAAIRGAGGTRNCDWWFTRDAVLIDTAGRYALQSSGHESDAAAWQAFLSLLRKARPRRPINGVLLTVSLQDLLTQASAERAVHASRLRERLQELQTRLGVRAPVYVIVTKADLLAGFAESFEALGQEQRDQVWGFSFDAAQDADVSLRRFSAQYQALVGRLSATLVERLQGERDPARRARMFGFVQEFAALETVMAEFLGRVFESGGALGHPVRFRGVYLSSGTQESTPIDRATGRISRALQLDTSAAEGLGTPRGKGFFLRRLLVDLVFPEQHLVAFNAKAERRRVVLRLSGFAAIALGATALLAGWATSYQRAANYTAEVAGRLPAVQAAVAALPPATDAGLAPLLPVLEAVRNAAHSGRFELAEPPLLDTLGLYQGDKLDAGAMAGHRRVLEHALLPRLAQRLEERLRAASADNLEQSYEALKGYLMLHTPERYDADELRAWITSDQDTPLADMPAAERSALERHLDALLSLGAPRATAPIDRPLVDGVREMLASFPLEYRIYARLKRRFATALPEFTVAAAAGPHARKAFERASGLALSRGVPGFFTREGHEKAFSGSLSETAIRLADEEHWVLGQRTTAAGTAALALSNEVPNRVRTLYLQDYVKTWDALLKDVRLVPMAGTAHSVEIARLLGQIDSPLATWLRAVARETTLVEAPAAPLRNSGLESRADRLRRARDDIASLVDALPAEVRGARQAKAPVERIVDDHFAALHRLVQGQPAPIDEILRQFTDAAVQLQAIDSAQLGKSAPPAGAAEKIRGMAATQPEPVRSMLAALADTGVKQGRAAERESMTGDLKPVHDFCVRAIGNRYPFASTSHADVLPEDFGQLFGTGGLLDDFFQRRLSGLVDTSGGTWAWKPGSDGVRPLAPAALADFQRAARIREVFFRNGGRTPSLRFDVHATGMGEGLNELALDVDGREHRLAPGGTVTLAWPGSRVASQIRLAGLPGGQPVLFEGPWALFRLFDRFVVQPGPQPEKFGVAMTLDGRHAQLEVTASSVFNPFRMREMQQFRCPGAL